MNEYVVKYLVCGKPYTTNVKAKDIKEVKQYCAMYLYGIVTEIELYKEDKQWTY